LRALGGSAKGPDGFDQESHLLKSALAQSKFDALGKAHRQSPCAATSRGFSLSGRLEDFEADELMPWNEQSSNRHRAERES
jgi:hypothetical protein